jgi:hypothetical protein
MVTDQKANVQRLYENMISIFEVVGRSAEIWVTRNAKALAIPLAVVALVIWRFVYKNFLYPKFFTPLRHIPLVSASSSANGNEVDEPSTLRGEVARLRGSIKEVPNNGLLRFYQDDKQERVLVVGAQALNEILVSNTNTFIKPSFVHRNLYNVVGNGILLAEGEIHKVRSTFARAFRHTQVSFRIYVSQTSSNH